MKSNRSRSHLKYLVVVLACVVSMLLHVERAAAAETGYHHGFQLWRWFGRRNDNIAMSFSIRIGVVW